MTAIYTWDVFSTLDGYGSYAEGADRAGYWSKQGPELLAHRAAQLDTAQRMVFGATTAGRSTATPRNSSTDPHSTDRHGTERASGHDRTAIRAQSRLGDRC